MSTNSRNENISSKDFIDFDDQEEIDLVEDIPHFKEKNNKSKRFLDNEADDHLNGEIMNLDDINITKIDEEQLKKVVHNLKTNIINPKKSYLFSQEKSSAGNFLEIEENFDELCYEYESKIDDEIFQEFKNREKNKFKAFLNEISQYGIDMKNYNELLNQSNIDASRIENSHNNQIIETVDNPISPVTTSPYGLILDKKELNNLKIFNEQKKTSISQVNHDKYENERFTFKNTETINPSATVCEDNEPVDKNFLNGFKLKKVDMEKARRVKFANNYNINTYTAYTSSTNYMNKNFYPYNLTDEEVFRKFSQIKESKNLQKFIKENINSSNPFRDKEKDFLLSTFMQGNKNKQFNKASLSLKKSQINTSSNFKNSKTEMTSKNLKYFTNTSNLNKGIPNFQLSQNLNSNLKINSSDKELSQIQNKNKNLNLDFLHPQHLEIFKTRLKEERLKFLILKEENMKLIKNFVTFKQKCEEKEKKSKIDNEYLINQISSLEDENKLLTNKLTDSKLNTNKLNSEILEKNIRIDELNSEIQNYEKKFNNLELEHSYLKSQLESLKFELNFNKNENSKKIEKIGELQEKVFDLEKEANEVRTRTNSEILNLRESKQSYDSLKTNYFEVKNQYELLNMKYQTVNDENFNLKRDLLLYEKEIRTKNETIQKLRNDLIESNKKSLVNETSTANGNNLNLNLNLNNFVKSSNEENIQNTKENLNFLENKNKNSINELMSRNNNFSNSTNFHTHSEDFNKNSKNIKNAENNYNIITNLSKSCSDGETRYRIVENQYFIMNKEREKIKTELNKLPEFPKKRDQIEKKKELEDKIESYSKDMAKLKQEMKELGIKNRES